MNTKTRIGLIALSLLAFFMIINQVFGIIAITRDIRLILGSLVSILIIIFLLRNNKIQKKTQSQNGHKPQALSEFSIKRTNYRDIDFSTLIKQLDSDLDQRYGIIQKQYNNLNQIDQIEHVVIAYKDEKAIACGCFKTYDSNTIEMKRFYVEPDFRGSGVATQMMTELEKWALETNQNCAVLETGSRQPEAIRFYSKLGYVTTENYGPYTGNPNSICMKKDLEKT